MEKKKRINYKVSSKAKQDLIELFALWKSNREINEHLAENYKITLTPSQLSTYRRKFQHEFLAKREALQTNINAIPTANLLYRLATYQELIEDLKNNIWYEDNKYYQGELVQTIRKGNHQVLANLLRNVKEELEAQKIAAPGAYDRMFSFMMHGPEEAARMMIEADKAYNEQLKQIEEAKEVQNDGRNQSEGDTNPEKEDQSSATEGGRESAKRA